MYLKHMDIFPEEIGREPQHEFGSLGPSVQGRRNIFQMGGGWGDGGAD